MIDLLCTDWPRCATVPCCGPYMRFLIPLVQAWLPTPFHSFVRRLFGALRTRLLALLYECGCNSICPSPRSSRQSNYWRHSAHGIPHMVGRRASKAAWSRSAPSRGSSARPPSKDRPIRVDRRDVVELGSLALVDGKYGRGRLAGNDLLVQRDGLAELVRACLLSWGTRSHHSLTPQSSRKTISAKVAVVKRPHCPTAKQYAPRFPDQRADGARGGGAPLLRRSADAVLLQRAAHGTLLRPACRICDFARYLRRARTCVLP